MSNDVIKYCSRAIVRYLNGNYKLFEVYVRRAVKLYEEEKKNERLHVPIAELARIKRW
ncbi:hypothetical protein [Thermoanaerobacter sp. YS13]|uniref:hypothetical protein n=1 Tax=Thermoanaerobacter sp. YS13 TaxID=1511746 RepID=UPI000ACD3F02|nr:hypothetical protein [Thermoanaerobacter sp. YS13]